MRTPTDRVLDAVASVPVATFAFTRNATRLMTRASVDMVGAVVGRIATAAVDAVSGGSSSMVEIAPPVPRAGEGSPQPVETAEQRIGPDAAELDPSELAIDGYDHLAARQVIQRLADLTDDELTAIGRYEAANRGRQTILGKVEQLRG